MKFGVSHSALPSFRSFRIQMAPALYTSLNTAHDVIFCRTSFDTPSKQNSNHVTQMELTVDQALQQGVAAHKEGNFQDAERLYRAILQSQPEHSDANHNLGVLAAAVGKPLEAIPFFELALEANPQIEQFWLSYIDVLMTLERFDDAKRVLVEGKESGVSPDKLDALLQRLQGDVPNDTNKTAKGQTLSEKRKTLAETKKSKKKGGHDASLSASPSQDQLNDLMSNYQAGRFVEAEALATSLTQQFPKHPFGWKVLSAVFRQTGRLAESLAPTQSAAKLSPQDAEAHSNLGVTLQEFGRLDEAEASNRQAIALNPDYAEAHYNLGITLKELGRLNESEASYKQAIALKPDYAEAHNNLGNTLKELRRLDESEASLRQAIALKPCFTEAHNNLGVTLKELGRLDESISSYVRAINLKADFHHVYSNLGKALKSARFNKGDQSLYPTLINLLNRGNFVRPKNVAEAILSLLRLDNLIEDALLYTTAFTEIKEVDRAINALAQVPLLHHLMRICPLPDLQLETLFVSMRRVLLANLEQIEASPELIHFLSTLSLHCFTNEYVYFETEEEAELIRVLEAVIAGRIAQASQPTITETLMLATYRPLHQYDWSEKLHVLDQFSDVKVRLVEEPLAERVIAQNMPVLSNVDDDVSRKVRAQYEESPYPQWVKLAIAPKVKSLAEVCNDAKLQLHSEHIKSVLSPSILIAGCGTGQHSIGTASRFANCKVTAVDLSRASLAYAHRKTSELGITSIKYLQADILNLGELGEEFDIIESSGVLHHMDEPMAGWRVLTDLLKTGGMMNIGLYSELARRHIVKAREDIALRGIGTSEDDIRQFRQFIVESQEEHHQQLTNFFDFFSLSTLRDLIFHVQEHRFTLPQIQHCLDELGLKFCGFEDKDIARQFKHSFGEEADACDLALWHQFEEENPHSFAGMYQFWCQKL
ncbi:tetratricopeptide repeat protein [Luminiphilus sp.]|nr:tetratricopeptide repeat protein [Luminiphilus sp.]